MEATSFLPFFLGDQGAPDSPVPAVFFPDFDAPSARAKPFSIAFTMSSILAAIKKPSF
jgi:hypothetical protein